VRRLSLILLCAAGPLAAQDAAPWRTSYFPYVMGNPSTGLMLVGHLHIARQADYDARVPFDGIFSVEGGVSARGSRFITAKFRGPRLDDGWRFAGDLGAVREATFGYYGQGPDGQGGLAASSLDRPDDVFRVHRTRYFAREEVTRRLSGPLQVSVAGGLVHYRYTPLPGSEAFLTDFSDAPLTGTDVTGRVSLIFDTRDNEFLPANGVLLEAGFYAGTGSFEERVLSPPPCAVCNSVFFIANSTTGGYAGGYAHVRGFVSPRSGTVIAGRLAARALDRGAPLDARYTLPGWEKDITVLGGAESHRSFVPGRFVGRGLLLGSLEIRHNVLDVGDYGAVTLIAFADAGRVFGANSIRWTLDGWKAGGGGGVALRVLRSALLTFNFAGGPDGFTFSMGNGWAF
jgi:hypothetical protein